MTAYSIILLTSHSVLFIIDAVPPENTRSLAGFGICSRDDDRTRGDGGYSNDTTNLNTFGSGEVSYNSINSTPETL